MKIVFFGTPSYVIPLLDGINKNLKDKSGASPIVAVVTQKPMPAGREKLLTYSEVDHWAHKRHIPVYFDPMELIKNSIHADIGIVASFGQIIPDSVIRKFPDGILNIHPSLLPKYRGASPARAAIVMGDAISGGTIIKIDSKMDHGPIVGKFKEEVYPDDTQETLRDRIFKKSVDVLLELINPYISGKIIPKAQDDAQAIYTNEVRKIDGFIPPLVLKSILENKALKKSLNVSFIKDTKIKATAGNLFKLYNALLPWPGLWTTVLLPQGQRRLRILKAEVKGGLFTINEVQLEGKGPVTWKQFREGYPEFKFK